MNETPEVVNLQDKLKLFHDHWNPRIAGELNGQYVKLAKCQGEFVWHSHENEDELFLVIEGELEMEFRSGSKMIGPGEFIIVPRGVEHRPKAKNEVSMLLFEPKETINTGDTQSDLRRDNLQKI